MRGNSHIMLLTVRMERNGTMSILSTAILLFLVLDPIGNIPLFLSALRNVNALKQKQIIIRELLIALGILLLFLFFGRYILLLFHISEPALSIAGGLILFLIALKMVFPGVVKMVDESTESEPIIVPLAVPLIAGPSAMATVMLFVAREPSRWLSWLFALLIAWTCSGIILYFSGNLRKLLGHKGITALERLMGLILTAVAAQMLLTGIKEFFFL
jgi:multiple antibiotic resistance protein